MPYKDAYVRRIYMRKYMRKYQKRQKAELQFLRGFYNQMVEDMEKLGIKVDKHPWTKLE